MNEKSPVVMLMLGLDIGIFLVLIYLIGRVVYLRKTGKW